MFLRKANINDLEWIYETLAELRGDVEYSLDSFKIYFEEMMVSEVGQIMIFGDEKDKIGLVTLNKFHMPRYLGIGYEMEEFVIHKNYRAKGYSYKMIEAVKELLNADKSVRKLIIKTNGDDSKRIYTKALNETDLCTFQVYLNKL